VKSIHICLETKNWTSAKSDIPCVVCISIQYIYYYAELHNNAAYGCESWTLRKNEETRLDAFEMKGLRKILRVSRTAKKTNKWVLNKAGVKRELLDNVKARKLAYYGHTMRKQGSCLE